MDIENAGLPGNWQAIDQPPVNPLQARPAPPVPNAMHNYFQGSLSPQMQHDAVFVGTKYGSPSVPSVPLMPVALNGSPANNAAITSIVESIVPASVPAAVTASGMIFDGTWDSATSYVKDDVVIFNISSYVALKSSTNVEPDSDATTWTLIGKNINLKTFTPAVSTVAFVQSGASTGGTNLGASKAFPSPNTVGNVILIYVYLEAGESSPIDPGATFVVSDTQGNVYTQIRSRLFSWYSGALASYDSSVFVAYNVKAGANTVSVVTSGAAVGATKLYVTEYTGNPTVNPYVSSSTQAYVSNPSPSTSTSVVLSTNQANQMVVIFSAVGSTTSGFTNRDTGYCDKVIPTASTATYITTNSFGAHMWAIALTNAAQNSSADTYYPSDVVIVNNVTYICILKAAPGILITDTGHWAVLATGGGGSSAGQGVVSTSTKTANYTALSTDNGTWLIFNSATPITLNLPGTAPTVPWFIGVVNIGAGLLSIDGSGHNINGSLTDMTAQAGQGTIIVTDGSDYFGAIPGLSARTSTSWTTGSLLNNQNETGTVTLAKTLLVVTLTVNVPSRIRLYSTSAAATADAGRAPTTPVPAGTQNEVIMDVALSNATGLTWVMSPAAWGSDGKATPDGILAYNVTNNNGGTNTVTATLKYIALEG